MNNFLVNVFLFAGFGICLTAALVILIPVLIVLGVLVFASLPILIVGAFLVLLGGFIDDGKNHYSYCRDPKRKKKPSNAGEAK